MSRHPLFAATALIVVLTVILTWPQALYLGTKVAAHDDPYLSMWRLAWIAHALSDHVAHFFDANIFYPNVRTLAYSDATLLEGFLAAPWLWARANPVLVYNVLLLGGIASSGVAMFVLAHHLTGSQDAALVSAVVFTLAPYRIEHFMHLELQWTMWMPLAFWAIHRVFGTGSMRFGVLAGALIWLQMMSCVYYGAFLGMMAVALAAMLAVSRPRRMMTVAAPLTAGALLAGALAAPYAWPYIQNARVLGPRDPGEITDFSARVASYFAAPQENWLWGWTAFGFGGNELHLFPGLAAVVLATIAVARRRERVVWIYLTLCALAIELSLGLNGWLYSWLHGHIWALRGFRAPARFAILASCALAVLAGFGFESLQRVTRSTIGRRVLLVGVLVLLGLEGGSAPMRLTEVPVRVPDIYKFLGTVGPSVIVELPIVDWNLDPQYMFWSRTHWQSLVNGYSGFTPPDYDRTVKQMRTFPDTRSIGRLRNLHVRYVLVHESFFRAKDRSALLVKLLQRTEFVWVGKYRDWAGYTEIFELLREP